jgi:glycosyltransferase involved in cell wall biosynthesis
MPALALSMIIKDAEKHLLECLASVRDAVDEIIVADTGSTDASIEIAQRAGARVFQIPWEYDFAKARNLSLAQATADWVLVIDADERLDPGAMSMLPSLLADECIAGYQVIIRNYVPSLKQKLWVGSPKLNDAGYAPAQKYPAYFDHQNVRLFRRNPLIYFTGCVHETVGHRIQEIGMSLSRASFIIHHFGLVADEQTLVKKLLLYREMGRRKIADNPCDARAHFELGIVELENFGNAQESLQHFERACALEPTLGVAWFFVGKCQFQLGHCENALQSLHCAESLGYETIATAELSGDANCNLGNYGAACAAYRQALKLSPANAALISKLSSAESKLRTDSTNAPG